MAGCSVTLLKVDDELLRLWDAPVNTPACAGASDRWPERRPRRSLDGVGARVRRARSRENADHLTELDAAIGDADHGTNMDRGMTAAVAALDDDPPATAGGAAQAGRA